MEAAQALQAMRRRAARGPSLAEILSPDVSALLPRPPPVVHAPLLTIFLEQIFSFSSLSV